MTGAGKTMYSSTTERSTVADGVARGDVLEADRGRDVTGADVLDLLALVGVHLEQAADALALEPLVLLSMVSPVFSRPE
jgi:hypothetical protein